MRETRNLLNLHWLFCLRISAKSWTCAFYLFIRDASWTERMVCRRGLLGVVDQVQETERGERRGTQTGQFGRFIAENPHTQLIGGKLKHPERALPGRGRPSQGDQKSPRATIKPSRPVSQGGTARFLMPWCAACHACARRFASRTSVGVIRDGDGGARRHICWRCCTARSKSLTSMCQLQSHPAQYVSGIPSAAILLSISHPIRCSTRCLANVRARISGPMIAL